MKKFDIHIVDLESKLSLQLASTRTSTTKEGKIPTSVYPKKANHNALAKC